MVMTDIDRFPVKDLMGRYGIGRTALYDRFKHANIKPDKEGTRSFVSGEQLAELDRLNDHLATGGSLSDFVPAYGWREEGQELALAPNSSADVQPIEPAANLEALAVAVSVGVERAIASQSQPPNPLWYMKELKQAVEEQWLLTTAEVRELIGVKPTAAKGEDSYQRGCWLFTKEGKIGSQTAWRVSKQGENELKIKK
jgi:hypothetical protein